MLLFKACPRCEGDMHTSGDMYGDYKTMKSAFSAAGLSTLSNRARSSWRPAAVPAKVLTAKKRRVA